MEVIVSAEYDAEVRRVSIANSGTAVREIDVTSYAELALAVQADDVAHPAFMKMFVATEYLEAEGTLLATRRRRTPGEPEVWAAHLAIADGNAVGKLEVETDRARFLGRGHGARSPIAMTDGRPLSNTVGTVLDPVFAIRRRVRVAPGTTVRIAFWTMKADTREGVLDLVDKQRDTTAFERAATLAWTQSQVQLHHLGIDPGEAGLFQRLAGHLLYAAPALRPSSGTIMRGAGAQQGLWPMGISGDLPIVLLRIADIENLDIARQLHCGRTSIGEWKQLAVDLVILNERASILPSRTFRSRSKPRCAPARQRRRLPRPSTSRAASTCCAPTSPTAEARALLASVARVVLVGQRGSLADQLERVPEPEEIVRTTRRPTRSPDASPSAATALEFFNGKAWAALLEDGQEYRDEPRPRPGDACTVDQCHCQSGVRLSRLRRGQRLYMVDQQSREPDYALVERPRERSKRGSALSER